MTVAQLTVYAGDHAKTIYAIARRAENEDLDISLSMDDLLSEGLYWMAIAIEKWKPGTGNKFAFVHQIVYYGIIQYERDAVGDRRYSTFRGDVYPVKYEQHLDSRRSDDMETAVAMMDHEILLGKMSERERTVIETFMTGMSGPEARRHLMMSRSMYDRTLRDARSVYETGTRSPSVNTYTRNARNKNPSSPRRCPVRV